MNTNHHIIILNLERSVTRKEALITQFERLGLTNYTFWPGFDANDIINMGFKVPIIKGVGKGRDLANTEISIIMSHLSALKHAQVMGYENVVILEDDVVICDDWEDRMTALLDTVPEDWDYVYLAGKSDYVVIPHYDEPTLIDAPKMVGAFSYVVNQNSIGKLIKFCNEFVTTYDDMIMHKAQTTARKLRSYLYIPFMAYHIAGPSINWKHDSPEHTSKGYFKTKL